MPLVILLYFVAYLDRANVGFAKLRMARDLQFSDEVFGFGIGIFFLGYLILEIPGALLVERWSARKWFARILVTWGLISACTAFVRTPMEFYVARFMLGVAEAGFFPGIIVYFTHWFPMRDRGRAMSGLVVAIPISLAIGAPVSALLLDVGWFGVAGWQWLFIVEGLPAVVLGVVTLFVLTDRPRDAKWLSRGGARSSRSRTGRRRERRPAQGNGDGSAAHAQRLAARTWHFRHQHRRLLAHILAADYGEKSVGRVGQLRDSSTAGSSIYAASVGVLYSGYSSDKHGDRKWHCVAAQVATGLLLAASTIPGQPFGLVMAWLFLTGLVVQAWPPPFWTLPATAASIGFINMCANLAGYLGNHLFGWLRSRGMTDSTGLLFLAGCYLLGGAIVSRVRVYHQKSPL
jgi:ACS family tartrate transporter-like MFS transporter